MSIIMKGKNKKSRADLMRELFEKSVVEIIDKKHLAAQLSAKKKIRVKLGVDPSSPDLHIGHLILLRKLRLFQELGCVVVFIIGDFTGTIGDPSGKGDTRPMLSEKEVKQNMKRYVLQVSKIIDIKKCEIHYNSEWYAKQPFSFFANLFSGATVQRVLERDDFQKRIASGNDISVLEILYPLFQGYDSVAVKADVEIGGTDQTFNVLMGRRMQRRFGIREQDIMTCSLLVGTDGKRKMSKSYANTINFSDVPHDMFGKIMSVPDNLLPSYYELVDEDFTREAKPMELKKRLAFLLVELLYDAKKAKDAMRHFEETFQKREPHSTRVIQADFLSDTGELIGMSQSEMRRLIKQGAIEFNGGKITSLSFRFLVDGVLRVGKKMFFKVQRKK